MSSAAVKTRIKIYDLTLQVQAAKEADVAKKLKNCRAVYWARKCHVNTRLERMTFKDLPYLFSLYSIIGDTPCMVVEKSVQCLQKGTMIWCLNGQKEISTVQVGDLVWTCRGRLRRVTQVFERDYDGKIIELDAYGCRKLTLTLNHPVWQGGAIFEHPTSIDHVYQPLFERGTRVSSGSLNLKDMFAESMFVDDYYCECVHCGKPLSRYQMLKGGRYCSTKCFGQYRKKHGIVKLSEKFQHVDSGLFRIKSSTTSFPNTISYSKALFRIIGYFMSEGFIASNYNRVSFSFANTEDTVICDLVDCMKSVFGLDARKHVYKNHTVVNYNDSILKGIFLSIFGVVDSFSKVLPDFVMQASSELLWAFFEASIYGDGHINRNQVVYGTSSIDFAYQLELLCNFLGLKAKLQRTVTSWGRDFYRLSFSGKQVRYIYDHFELKAKGNDLSFPSPIGNSMTVLESGAWRSRIRSTMETHFRGKVYNFSVEEDESYIANGIAVHNCGLSELFIIQSHIEAGEMGLTVMYVLPKYELRNRFVNNRIYKLHRRVATYNRMMLEAQTKVHRTSLMHFGKGTLSYVGSNVQDEFIEIPVDSAYVDEKDRCNLPNLLMLPDRLTASPYKFHREISNPTTEGFGIDERYMESSQGVWMLKCPGCGKQFVPDFWKHVVEEINTNTFVPRDKDADPDPQAAAEFRLIHDCGSPVDRLQNGEWVHAYLNREWQGFRVSQIFSKFTPLRKLYRIWSKAVGNDLKTQLFYNSNLGLPFSSKGSKITRAMLNDCRQLYEWPVRRVGQERARLMGVDVGEYLHVIMRERVRTAQGIKLRLIGIWTLPGFNQLAQLLREWKPRWCVIDAMPEIHKIMDLKSDFHSVWSSRFQADVTDLVKHKDKRELRMDRTAIIDYVRQAVELQNLLLPMQAEFLEDGEYYNHMQASTRILEPNETHPEKSRFIWKEGSRPDHFMLAEAYCMQAGMIMPEHGVFDFFDQEAKALGKHEGRRKVPAPDLTDEEREKIAKLQHLTPNVFLNKMFKQYVNKDPPKRPVDDQRISDSVKFMYTSQGYVDVALAANMSEESEEDVRRILGSLGFKESKISGQYIK